MSTISQFKQKYFTKIDALDLELLISAVINKPREFVLTHPEYKISATCNLKLETFIQRRFKNEPIAYILGRKEFYGLEFKVDKNTLIPRPETEQLVENVLKLQPKNKTIIDLGTGSGNIIISLAKNLKGKNIFLATDISLKALNIARKNAHFHKVSGKIKFLRGNLLKPILKTTNHQLPATNYIIVANLPYLSHKIYNSVPKDVKNYEPKSALLSDDNGLDHYKKLLKQLKKLQTKNYPAQSGPRQGGGKLQTFIEFGPEQKTRLKKAVQTTFPKCSLVFFKDLAGKFRIIQIAL